MSCLHGPGDLSQPCTTAGTAAPPAQGLPFCTPISWDGLDLSVFTNYIQVKRSGSLHHVPLGQECNEGSLESIPFHCRERRELTEEKP